MAASGVVDELERGLGLGLLAEGDRELGSDSVVYLCLVLHFFFSQFLLLLLPPRRAEQK